MSLLSICKRVLEETGWPAPNSIATSTDLTARQIFTIANTALRSVSEMFPWPHLQDEYSFNTVVGQSSYAWPTFFRLLVPKALYNRSDYYSLKGGYDPEEWLRVREGKLAQLDRIAFRVMYYFNMPFLEITPAPTSVETLVGFYTSNTYAVNSVTLSGVPLYTQDSDYAKIPEALVELNLKWRFRRAKGLDFSAELAEFLATVNQQYAQYRTARDIPIGGPSSLLDLAPGYVRENGFGV